jgi:pyruvate/2-oxoglutarate dehydrogenase complex dihydrolipoamide dehydrogenase (E3) component
MAHFVLPVATLLDEAYILAHKAMVHEGHVTAVAMEVITAARGNKELMATSPSGIPALHYTDPKVAWVGLTRKTKTKGIKGQKKTYSIAIQHQAGRNS